MCVFIHEVHPTLLPSPWLLFPGTGTAKGRTRLQGVRDYYVLHVN